MADSPSASYETQAAASHAGQSRDLLLEARLAVHEDHLVSVQPQHVLQSEGRLAIDRRGADDQHDQRGELRHDEALTHRRRARPLSAGAFQRRRGREAGQHQRRIRPGDQAGEQSGSDYSQRQRRIVQIVEDDAALEKRVRCRQSQPGDGHAEQHGREDVEQGFAHELDDQVAPARADGLAHPYLDRPADGARGHQRDEVDRRDDDDQQSDDSDLPNHRAAFGGEVHVLQRLEPEAPPRGARVVAGGEGLEPFADAVGGHARRQPCVGPVEELIFGRARGPGGVARRENLELLQMGLARDVLEHRPHAHRMRGRGQRVIAVRGQYQ